MNTPLWVDETTSIFWAEAGESEQFPRNLRYAIANALPLTVVSLPKLRPSVMSHWLQEQSIQCGITTRDRALRACLVARYGHGIIFIDGVDPDDEQRFSLAHELAHFLKDYWQPRHTASERLGASVLEVFDGERLPRQEERVHALLAHVKIGYHIHLMERTSDGHLATSTIEAAERNADRLAFELLAPAERVLLETASRSPGQRREEIKNILIESYGLPVAPAAQYAALLVPLSLGPESFIRRLGLVR
jgi:hypothetical protein